MAREHEAKNIQTLLALNVAAGSVFFDIGADPGEYTQFALNQGWEVHAFEPHPELYEKTIAPLKANPNLHARKAAAWHTDGTGLLYGSIANNEGSTLMKKKTNVTTRKNVAVTTINLGRYLTELDRDIAVLKIDAEGAEYDILQSILNEFDPRRIQNYFVEDHERKMTGWRWHLQKKRILNRFNELNIPLKPWD